jgi:membrane protease YdiL (CAAX protease family)
MSNDSSRPPRIEESPAKGRQVAWGPGVAVVLTVFNLIGSQYVAGFLLVMVLAIFQSSEKATQAWLDSTTGSFYFVALSDILIFSTVWWFLRHLKTKIRVLGYNRSPELKDAGYALVGYGVYFSMLITAFLLVTLFTGINLDQRQELGFDDLLGWGNKLMAFVSLVILPPFVEETVFRGFLFMGLRKKLRFGWAMLITSLLFAAPHLLGSSEGLLWVAGLDTLLMSFVLCYLREKTGALWACIALHAIKNTVAFVILLTSAGAL